MNKHSIAEKKNNNKTGDKTSGQINLLELIPVQNMEWETRENGLVSLLKPKFKNPLLTKYLLPHLKNPYYRVKLDEVGTCVWKQCNGENSVKEIAEILYQEFGQKLEPVHDRLSLFLQSLERNQFIKYKNLNQNQQKHDSS